MERDRIKKLVTKLLACACCVCALFAILFSSRASYSAVTTICVPATTDVYVYVSGDGVKRDKDGNYTAPAGGKITVTAVNGGKLFSSMTVNGNDYSVPVARDIVVPASDSIDITVNTAEPYAENKGEYFGSPYLISREADILALARILKGEGTVSDFARFGEENGNVAAFRYGYYRLTTNIFINSEEFFGLGSRAAGGVPFQGCFDFAGYAVTLSVIRTEHVAAEFAYVPEEQISVADYGFFSLIYGADDKPCLIKNADVQGYIALNTSLAVGSIPDKTRVNAGGLAGTAGKNIVFDGIESQVSVSAMVKKASLYIGGMFGICSSDVDNWCSAVYDGEHNDVSGVTYGEKAAVYAGCFAGVLQNAYADGVVIEGEAAMVLSNSLGDVSGSAISGGFAGVVVVMESPLEEFSEPKSVFIRDVDIIVLGEYAVHSVIANDKSTDKAKIDPEKPGEYSAMAVSGGFCGTIYRQSDLDDESIGISVAGIRFVQSAEREEEPGRIQMRAQTQDGSSAGSVFAGGAVGYVYTDGIKYITHGFDEENFSDERGMYIFECPVDIFAVQNGVGPAFAGGVFGYNCFNLSLKDDATVKFHITAHEYDFTVTAVQTASSSTVITYDELSRQNIPVTFPVCAGGYTSVLQPGYSANNVEFSVKNGKIRAYREVGSTAIGEICSGGYAGAFLSYSDVIHNVRGYNGTYAGSVGNLKITYSSQTLIEAACYSFDSVDSRPKDFYGGNNVCAGGAIGLAVGISSLDGITVEWKEKTNLSEDSEYFVYGVQNGGFPSGYGTDLKSEGFVGGAIGLAIDTVTSGASVFGDPSSKSVVYFESTNNPDTASVGGIVGAVWRIRSQNRTLLSGASVSDMHVAGKAYNNMYNDAVKYDIYVGGAIGVLANPSGTMVKNLGSVNGAVYVKNVNVSDCVIESIGEDQMATFAAGVAAGIWWASTSYMQGCTVTDSSITASSVSGKTYAGGINGLIQRGVITDCVAVNTDVRSVSVNSEASAAGVFAWAKEGWTVSGNVSNATLHASGVTGKKGYKGGIGHPPYNKPGGTVSMLNNYAVSENAGTDAVYLNQTSYSGYYGGAALHLIRYGVNEYTITNVNGSVSVFPGVTSSDSVLSVKSSNEGVATVDVDANGVTVTGKKEGVSYISVYAMVNGKEYRLCSYPVTVVSSSSEDFSLKIYNENEEELSADNSDGYAVFYKSTSAKYLYFRHNAGNTATSELIKVCSQGLKYFPCKPLIYDVKTTAYAQGVSAEDRALQILAAKSSATQVSSFNGRAVLAFDGDVGAHDFCTITSSPTLKESVIVVMEFVYNGFTHGVIAEFVPNEITGITITPDDGTPPIYSYTADDGYRHYVYCKGDTVRFSEKLKYRYDTKRSYIVETSYSGANVATNGTVVLTGDGPYAVTCTVLGTNISDTVYLDVKEETSFAFELNGADVVSDRKMIEGADFAFTSAAQPGYGLAPEVSVTIGDYTAAGNWNGGDIEFELNGVKYVGTVAENANVKYSYDFVIPSALADLAKDDGITISITYSKTYSLVFFSNFGDYEFFKTTVRADEMYSELVIEGLSEWLEYISSERYGFDFAGFYQVIHATDLAAYGRSFEELCENSSARVSGTARFYARWTYNVVTEAPEGAEVRSSFSETMLDDGYVVPADDKSGFGFVINVSESWCGTPRFGAFIRLKDGTYTEITDEFAPAATANSYEISAANLGAYDSGAIYILVYADSLEFYSGDAVRHEEKELYSDGVFTAVYNVNYGSGDGPAETAFNFGGKPLPSGTSLRLFYRKNSVTVWSGGYVLSSAASEIPASAFSSMSDGSALTLGLRAGAKSEEFILVVTLPINTDGFGITDSLAESVFVKAYNYAEVKKTYGKIAVAITDKPISELAAASEEFTLYKADIHSVKVNATGSLYYTRTGVKDGLTDRRRGGDSYMWKIELTGGGAIGDTVFSAFGTETVRTTTAVYYMAVADKYISTSGLSGYTVTLTEVKNAQQPAGGITLFTTEIR